MRFLFSSVLKITVFSFITLACRHTNTSHSSAKATEFPILETDVAPCKPGETPLIYSLVSSPTRQITKADTGLSGDFTIRPSANSYLSGYRFEICMDESDNVRLNRVLHPTSTIGLGRLAYTSYTPDSSEPDAGLFKAISENNYENLQIKIHNTEMPEYSYLIKGAKTADGYSFIAWSNFNPTANNPLATNGEEVVYGELMETDALSNFLKNNDRLFDLSKLKIELRYETSGQPGMYVGYTFHSVKVKDTNSALPQSITATYNDDHVNEYVTAKLTHHGLTDSIQIKLPKATYTIESNKLSVKYANPQIPPRSFTLNCQYAVDCGSPLEAEGGSGGGGGSIGGNPPPIPQNQPRVPRR